MTARILRSFMGDWCEVYAYGLRNPYRFSFDRDAGAIAVEDVGASTPAATRRSTS